MKGNAQRVAHFFAITHRKKKGRIHKVQRPIYGKGDLPGGELSKTQLQSGRPALHL
jgi:hypothetical protein